MLKRRLVSVFSTQQVYSSIEISHTVLRMYLARGIGLNEDMSDNGNELLDKASVDSSVIRRSVQAAPTYETSPGAFTLYLASIADEVPPWGRQPVQRDRELRTFWPTESFLASAISSIAMRNAAMSWKVDGPPRIARVVQDMLLSANLGKGWEHFIVQLMLDLLCQDNGAFIELIRQRDSEYAPVIGIAHLDAGRCRRTGMVEFPVVYTDRDGVEHRLRWYQVIELAEMPSPVETMNGMQLCAVSRVLRAAQVLRDITIYKREKIGGRHHKAIHFVGGAKRSEIDDARKRLGELADNQGLIRYIEPIIVAGLDPERPVSVATIDLASLPDGYDEDITLRWYIANLALGLGADYQDLAPLPGGNLGTSAQSEILHRKSRGKGAAFFQKIFTHPFNFYGVMPQSCTFRFDEQDTAADMETAELRKARAEARKIDIDSGVLTAQVARQMMADEGDLTPELLALLGEQDATADITVTDEAQKESTTDIVPFIPETEVIEMPPQKKSRWISLRGKKEEPEDDPVTVAFGNHFAALNALMKHSIKEARLVQSNSALASALAAMGDAVSALQRSADVVPQINIIAPEPKAIEIPQTIVHVAQPDITIQPQITVQAAAQPSVTFQAPERKDENETEIIEILERDANKQVRKLKRTKGKG